MEDYDHILARYRRMRSASREMNSALIERCAPRVEQAAKDLGVWVNGAIVMDIDKSCVLMDRAIYDCPEGGRNAVERLAAEHPPVPGSDAQTVLGAMQLAFFSLFQVREVVKEVGVRVTDILRDREHFLADVALSQTAVEGLVLASRVLPFEDFIMTTGAALPVETTVLEWVADCLNRCNLTDDDLRNLPREAWSEIEAKVIRACLDSSGDQRITYESAPGGTGEAADSTAAVHVGRNDPCPCGSGKKYKKCCGKNN